MPWTADRRSPLPRDWAQRRAAVLRRDNYRCTVPTPDGSPCGYPAAEVDHIVPRARGGGNEDANLRAICPGHHRLKSSAEATEGRAIARANGRWTPPRSPKLAPEPHPGAYRDEPSSL